MRAKGLLYFPLVIIIVLGITSRISTSSENQPSAYPLKHGFPVDIPGHVTTSAPTVADLDNDGRNELLVANYGGLIFGFNASGSQLPGYPLDTGGRIIGHMALGDLNADGDLEIVAGAGSRESGKQGKVFIWQPDGTPLPGWPKQVARFGDVKPAKISTVVLADIDQDADLEVIAGTNNNVVQIPNPPDSVPDLYVWHHNGSVMSGKWPAKDRPSILGTIAVGDLDSDGKPDIAVGRDYERLFAYDKRGDYLPGWPVDTLVPEDGNKNVDPRIVHKRSIPTLADLDHDGLIEYIVIGARKLPGSIEVSNSDLLVLQPDGSRKPGWETPAGGSGVLSSDYPMQQAPAVADLDGDFDLEIVAPTQDGRIRAYNPDKTLLWQFNYAQGKLIYASEPVIGDVDDDGKLEVVFGTYDPTVTTVGPVGLWILEHDGSVKAGYPLPVEGTGIMAAPALVDLDNDGYLDIVAVSRKGNIYAWDTGTPYRASRLPWPVARHDLQRTAFVDPKSFKPSLTTSAKIARPPVADHGDIINYTLRLVRTGLPLTSTVRVTDVVPSGLRYLPGTLFATHGTIDETDAPTLHWTGLLSDTTTARIGYSVRVLEEDPSAITNSATVNAGVVGRLTLSEPVIVNGYKFFLQFLARFVFR